MKKLILLLDKIFSFIARKYRNFIFYLKTNQRAYIVKNITLINTNLKIGNNVTLYPNVMFFGDGLIQIGDNVDIGNGTIIYSSKLGGIRIGNNTSIAAHTYIIDHNHGIELGHLIREQNNLVAPICIGNDVWIAHNCTILKGTIIGDGAVIGAKSLVNSNVEPYSVVCGVPAKHIKYRA